MEVAVILCLKATARCPPPLNACRGKTLASAPNHTGALSPPLSPPLSLATTQVLDETVVVTHSDDMFAPVGLLRVIKCHTEPKAPLDAAPSAMAAAGTWAPDEHGAENSEAPVEGGDTVDPQAAGAAEVVAADVDSSQAAGVVGDAPCSGSTKRQGAPAAACLSSSLCCLPYVHEGSGGLVYLSGIRAARPAGDAKVAAEEVAARQTADCLRAARAGLDGAGVSFRDVCFVHLYLRDMGHFSAVNEEYCK